MDLATECYRLARLMPKAEEFRVTSQSLRATASVPANIAEGWMRGSRKDYARFVSIARGSLAEVETFMQLAQRVGLLPEHLGRDQRGIGGQLVADRLARGGGAVLGLLAAHLEVAELGVGDQDAVDEQRFVQDRIDVAPNTPFDLAFANLDEGVQHNVAIYEDLFTGAPAADSRAAIETVTVDEPRPIFVGELFPGVRTRPGVYLFAALGDPLRDFLVRYRGVAALILALICLYRLSDFVLNIMNPFYLDLGFTKTEIAEVRKVFGVAMSIANDFKNQAVDRCAGVSLTSPGCRKAIAGASLLCQPILWLHRP